MLLLRRFAARSRAQRVWKRRPRSTTAPSNQARPTDRRRAGRQPPSRVAKVSQVAGASDQLSPPTSRPKPSFAVAVVDSPGWRARSPCTGSPEQPVEADASGVRVEHSSGNAARTS
jgi:hypothetical protein